MNTRKENTRKDRLRSLFGAPAAEDMSTPSPAPASEPAQKRAPSAAVKAMGLSLGSLAQDADEARRLRDTLAAGEQVVELSPDMLERSPFLDRLSEGARDDEDFAALKESMATHGQQVPVLVRPHPDEARAARGFYQVAYGHRRVQAARELGRPVRAVVRRLDDAALALAQGKENAERRGLSFIERAFFARSLMDHGFDRAAVQAVLSVHKSEMTRLLQVAEAVPLAVMRAIGPAPKAGRPRWLALGELLAGDAGGLAYDEMSSQGFRDADSDTRFQRLFDRLTASARGRTKAASARQARTILDAGGRAIADLVSDGRAARLTIQEAAGPGFADFVAAELPRLHAAYRQMKEEGR